jgi:hypothetical protein
LVLAAAAGRARYLRLKTTLLARGAYPQAAKPLSAANGVGRFHIYPDVLPFSRQPKIEIMSNVQRRVCIIAEIIEYIALIFPI